MAEGTEEPLAPANDKPAKRPRLSRRSRGREVVLQMLYQLELNPTVDRAVILNFTHDRLNDTELEPFALALYDGVRSHGADIDRRLGEAASNWRLARMAIVDRNVLRLGAYELLHTPETPPSVALNEAIELARRYGSANSPAFVNGILDRLHQTAHPAK
jgi:N utilization substance protein B